MKLRREGIELYFSAVEFPKTRFQFVKIIEAEYPELGGSKFDAVFGRGKFFPKRNISISYRIKSKMTEFDLKIPNVFLKLNKLEEGNQR